MKKNVSPAIVIAVLAVVVLIGGIAAYRVFFSNPYASPLSGSNLKEFEQAKSRSAIHQNMQHTDTGGRGMHSR